MIFLRVFSASASLSIIIGKHGSIKKINAKKDLSLSFPSFVIYKNVHFLSEADAEKTLCEIIF